MLGSEPGETPFQPVPIDDGELRAGADRRRARDDTQLDERAAPIGSRLAIAGPDHETTEPRIDSLRVAEPANIAPGGDERLLDGIVGPIVVSKNQGGDCIQSADRPVDEHGEGVMIALPRPLRQVSLHVATLSARPSQPSSQPRGVRDPSRFHLR
jgi:hypothetical protein